jgi:hypothetical protein
MEEMNIHTSHAPNTDYLGTSKENKYLVVHVRHGLVRGLWIPPLLASFACAEAPFTPANPTPIHEEVGRER